jgi:serine/threonine protein kinase
MAHGDLKLENVLLNKENDVLVPKLIDFGSSYIEGQETFEPVVSRPWNAPEITTGTIVSVADIAASDMYSFGLLCSQILIPAQNLSDTGLLFTRQQPHSQWQDMLQYTDLLKRTGSLGEELIKNCSTLPQAHRNIVSGILETSILGNPKDRIFSNQLKHNFFASPVNTEATVYVFIPPLLCD